MSAELDEDKRVVIILGRDREEPSKLDHRLLVFEGGESQADPDSSKLFIYNSLWNSQHGMEGSIVHCSQPKLFYQAAFLCSKDSTSMHCTCGPTTMAQKVRVLLNLQ